MDMIQHAIRQELIFPVCNVSASPSNRLYGKKNSAMHECACACFTLSILFRVGQYRAVQVVPLPFHRLCINSHATCARVVDDERVTIPLAVARVSFTVSLFLEGPIPEWRVKILLQNLPDQLCGLC